MKKILLSFLCLIAAIGVNAQAEVDIPIDEGWGSAWNAEAQYADGILTITTTGDYGAGGYNLNGADWSKYDALYLDIESHTAGWGQILVRDAEDKDIFSIVVGTISSKTTVKVAIDPSKASAIGRICVQGAGAGDVYKISRIYLTEAVNYDDTPAASLEVNGSSWQFFPAAQFEGYSENAKVVFTVEIAGSANYGGWGIGEITTPTVTKNEDWSLKDGIIVLTVSGGTDGVFTYEFKMKELMPALTSWPDADGNYGLVSNMYGQNQPDRGECTVSLKSVEIFEPVVDDPEPVNIEISPADGDISAALAAAEEGVQKIGDIYINLAEGGTYTISSSIVGPANIVVIGSNSTIDASSLDGPFIALANVENPTEWTNLSVGIGGVNIKGLSKPLFSSTCKNYLIEEFMVINSVVEVAGDVTVLDFTKGSAVHHFTMGGNTFYAPTATEKAFYSSQGGQKITECAEGLTQGFDIQMNTFYNLTKSKNFFTHRQNSQTWLKFDVEDNIFVNCGKKGQTIKGINGGGSSANPVWTVKGNLFNFDDADTSAEESTGDDEEPIQDSIAGVANFDAPEAGDFNCVVVLAEGLEAPEKQPGDPRWRLVWQQTAAPVSSGEVLYALAEGDTFTSGQVVEVLYDETGAKAGDVVATIQYGEAGEDYADFKAAKADGQVEGFTAFTEGNGINGNKAGGTFYTIVPKYDGVISAGIVLNGGKAFHLTVDGVQNSVFDGNTVTNKYYGTFSFNVEAGKSYKFWCDGSKLGFYGFNYVWGPDVEPITELPLNDETVGIATVNTAKQQDVYYNLQGVRVAQPTKGLYIINGKKVVVK